MRYFVSCLIILGALSCGNTTPGENPKNLKVISNQSGQASNSIGWEDNFLKLSSAISNGDRKAVKMFIDFPLRNEGNEIWFLADSKLVMEIDPDKIKPFTESDFDKYFSSIFTIDLRKTLEKIDTTEFFKSLNNTSPEIEVVKDSKSKLTASFDKAKNRLTLLLLNTGQGFEYAIQYEFDYTSDQNFKFRQVRVAG